MNKARFLFLSLLVLLTFFSCTNGDDGPAFTLETVSLKGLQDEDVYFIFTNPSPDDTAPVAPSVTYSQLESRSDESGSPDGESSSLFRTAAVPDSGGIIDAQLWKTPEGLNIEAGALSRGSGVSFVYVPPSEDIGTEKTFIGVSSIDADTSIPATCRSIDSFDGKTLVIYVADDCWFENDNGSKDSYVDQGMVDALGDEFLPVNGDKGIRDWVTDIYGEPWGDHPYSNMIESGAEDYMTILLYDIAGDNSTNGGIVGYFNSGNNFLKTSYSDSNERLMFAMDAVLYATESDGSWDKTDYWPQSVFSTLAHEFQHMVHYYQKQIVSGVGSSAWFNEMCSLVTEDLLADKIGVPGPRGVDPPTDGSAAFPGDCSSTRISTYNYWSDDSLTHWGSNIEDQLKSYASAYAFGAYLARNYGGAALFREIVQSEWTDEQAVIQAISTLGYGNKSFGELLTEWAVAALGSDNIDTTGLSYNSGDFRTSSPSDPEGAGYNLGSINLYNYAADDGTNGGSLSGPVPYGDENGTFNPLSLEATPPASNVIFLAGSNLSGDVFWDVEIPRGMTLTVLRK